MNEELYQAHILQHAKHPHNKEELADATISVPAKNTSCGDAYTLQLNVQDGFIEKAAFTGIGCAISQAAASLLTDKLTGMSTHEAAQVSEEDVYTLLHVPISTTREKCALLLWRALHEALKEHHA